MTRFKRLVQDILSFENDPLRVTFEQASRAEAAVLMVEPMKDTVDDWFIGFGSSWLHGEKVTARTEPITLQHAYDAATTELYECLCNAPQLLHSWRTLSSVRQDVLVQMVYQLGLGGVTNFRKMLQNLNDGQFEAAAAEMLDSRWRQQTPLRAACLASRMERNIWVPL